MHNLPEIHRWVFFHQGQPHFFVVVGPLHKDCARWLMDHQRQKVFSS